jgi:hypothetical protein
VDDAGVLDLSVGHVVVGVLFELLGEDQQAVQRGAQLVRHVGDELGLVLRGDRELADLLLDQPLGLLGLEVLLLGQHVLLGEQAGLARQVGVGAAQLLLLGRSSSACERDCTSSASVSPAAWIVFRTMPTLSVIESRKAWWVTLNGENDASSTTARSVPSKRTGRTMMFSGTASPSPELIRT